MGWSKADGLMLFRYGVLALLYLLPTTLVGEIIIPFANNEQELAITPKPDAMQQLGATEDNLRQQCIEQFRRMRLVQRQQLDRGEAAADPDPQALVYTHGRFANGRYQEQHTPLRDLADITVRPLTRAPFEQTSDLPARLASTDFRTADAARRDLQDLQARAAAIVPQLIAMLQVAEDSDTARRICSSLALMGPQAAEAVPLLAERLQRSGRDADPYADALAGIGMPAVPALEQTMRHRPAAVPESDLDSHRTRLLAAEALYAGSSRGQQIVREALQDVDPAVRQACTAALASTAARNNPQNVHLLVRLLADQVADVRREAATSLGAYGPVARPAIPPLLAALDDPEDHCRTAAIDAICRIGPDDAAIATMLPKLKAILQTPSNELSQIAALYAISQIGPVAAPLVPQIGPFLKQVKPGSSSASSNVFTAVMACEALAAIGGTEAGAAIESLLPLLGHRELHVSEAALKALRAIGPEAAPAAQRVRRILKGRGGPNLLAIGVLGAIGPSDSEVRDALPEMAPYTTAYRGSLSEPPDSVLRVMASIDPKAATELIAKAGRRPAIAAFDDPARQAAVAIERIQAIQHEAEQVTAALAGPTAPATGIGRTSPSGVFWYRAIRPGDTLARVVALLGVPDSAGDGRITYRFRTPDSMRFTAPVCITIANGQVQTVVLEPANPATVPSAP